LICSVLYHSGYISCPVHYSPFRRLPESKSTGLPASGAFP